MGLPVGRAAARTVTRKAAGRPAGSGKGWWPVDADAQLFTAVLLAYAAETGHYDVLDDITTPADSSFSLLDQANLVEVIAESVWRVVMREDIGLPDTRHFQLVAHPSTTGNRDWSFATTRTW